MLCPKCYGKTRVTETRNNVKESETYRRRICNDKTCCHKFYTVEFVAEETNNFKESWKEAIKGGV